MLNLIKYMPYITIINTLYLFLTEFKELTDESSGASTNLKKKKKNI